MDHIPIIQFTDPKGARLEICPCFITKDQEQSFSREKHDNPYAHLRELEQVCSCLHILGMSHETLKWKLFLFSLTGLAKLWYAQTIESVQGDWEVQ